MMNVSNQQSTAGAGGGGSSIDKGRGCLSHLVRGKKMVSYLFGCLALNGPQRELFGTFQGIEMNKISQEIFGNQPIFNLI